MKKWFVSIINLFMYGQWTSCEHINQQWVRGADGIVWVCKDCGIVDLQENGYGTIKFTARSNREYAAR